MTTGPSSLKIFFDGGCRPNPGRIEVAVVARGISHFFDDIGYGTSSDAEWIALCQALRLARSIGETDFELVGDCAHVISQAKGIAKCRTESSRRHHAEYLECTAMALPRRIRWTPRAQNLAGIALARRRGR